MALDALGADRLAAALLGLHAADEARAHGDDDELRRRHRHAGSEGQVAQQIEHGDVAVAARRQVLVQPIEHQPASPAASRAISAFATAPAFEPFDPFTITTSPGSAARATSGESSAAVSAYAPRRVGGRASQRDFINGP